MGQGSTCELWQPALLCTFPSTDNSWDGLVRGCVFSVFESYSTKWGSPAVFLWGLLVALYAAGASSMRADVCPIRRLNATMGRAPGHALPVHARALDLTSHCQRSSGRVGRREAGSPLAVAPCSPPQAVLAPSLSQAPSLPPPSPLVHPSGQVRCTPVGPRHTGSWSPVSPMALA